MLPKTGNPDLSLDTCLGKMLRSHFTDPEALRADDFAAFFQSRENALMQVIERAMGRAVIRDVGKAGAAEESWDLEEDET